MKDFYTNSMHSEQLKKIKAAKVLSKAGGEGRAKALSPKRRAEIASKAAKARWNKNL